MGNFTPNRTVWSELVRAGFPISLINIRSIGTNRIKVESCGGDPANLLLDNKAQLGTSIGRIFIPNMLLYKTAIIKDVDVTLYEEGVLNNIISIYPLVSVKRLSKKVISSNDNSSSRIPIPDVIIKFRSQWLPSQLRYILCYSLCRDSIYLQGDTMPGVPAL